MKDPVSRLHKRQRVRERVRSNVGSMTTFSSMLEMKFRFEIGRKSVDRDGSVNKWIEMVF